MANKSVTYLFVDDKDYEDFVKMVVRQEVEHLDEVSIQSETEDGIVLLLQPLKEEENSED